MPLRIRATIWQTPEPERFIERSGVTITVDDGWIQAIDTTDDRPVDIDFPADQVLIPGLIDLHIHAPQWPQLGTGYDLPLEEWLFEYTFPLEARYDDLTFARSVWNEMVPTLLGHGTTTAVYYGSTHVDATTALAQACVDHGQRAWVGRVAMDHPEGTPEWYRDSSAATAVDATRRSITEIEALDDPRRLVRPIITPRFIPACSDELLRALGKLASDTGLLVQTHCSESDWEHEHVFERMGVSDTTALDSFGLVRAGTVLAHGGLLGDDDLVTIAERGAGIAHCPLSNVYFGNAVFPVGNALATGVNVGLGTDIAGGPSPSVLAQAAQSVTSARMLDEGVDPARTAEERGRPGSRISATTGFWLATLGGADVLGEPLGLLEEGRRFDAVALDTTRAAGRHGLYPSERRFEQLVRLADHSDVRAVWVDGQQVVTR